MQSSRSSKLVYNGLTFVDHPFVGEQVGERSVQGRDVERKGKKGRKKEGEGVQSGTSMKVHTKRYKRKTAGKKTGTIMSKIIFLAAIFL